MTIPISNLCMWNEIRNKLHQNPGISGCEAYAHDLIVDCLTPLSPAELHQHVGGYGVVACFGTNKTLPAIVFRADIDALPIGHRCGHDGHTTILLRFAKLLSETPAILEKYNVLLVFQPEEETGYGAQKILDSAVLDGYAIGAVFGLHNLPGYPMGQVVLSRRTFAAASTGVVFHLEGRETHASTPEKGINPGLAVAELIAQMDAECNSGSLDIDGFRQSTLICVKLGEEAFGTSAAMADVMFTLRAFTNHAMDCLVEDANRMAQEVARKYHLRFSVEYRDPFPATENVPHLVEEFASLLDETAVAGPRHISENVADGHLGADVCLWVYKPEPFRWSEDFAHYLRRYPGLFFGIGAGVEHLELHHPDYDFPDQLIEPAARLFLLLASNAERFLAPRLG